MTTTISEEYLKEKSRFVTDWLASHNGELAGCEEQWAKESAAHLITASNTATVENHKASEQAKADSERAADLAQRRSQMSPERKAAFIDTYGAEAFRALQA